MEVIVATVNGRTFQGKTMTEIKRKASIIANNRYDVLDKMIVSHEGREFRMYRYNKLCPNNTIVRDRWH